jgi:hypothetical protein
MSFWSVKDFSTGVAAKVASFIINTDQNASAHVQVDSTGAEVIGTKADAVWDGAAASPSAVSLWKYVATKLEAVRALLAGTLTVGLPAGAATASAQATLLAAVQAAALPTGAATAAEQALILAAVQAATPAGELHIGEIGGNSAVVGGSFARLANATAYALGQLVANSATAGTVTPIACAVARKNAGTGVLTGLRLSKTGTSVINALFRVHLFKTAPTTTVADAGVFAGAVNGVTSIALGYVDVTLDQSYSDGAKGFVAIQAKAFDTAAGSQNIYALIEARAAYTPVSGETFTVSLEVLRD